MGAQVWLKGKVLFHHSTCQHRFRSSLVLTMLRQAMRIAGRQAAIATRTSPTSTIVPHQARAFGAITQHHAEKELARPFKGASRSEPEMEYIEEPSMLYMTCLVASPWIFSFWFLTKFV